MVGGDVGEGVAEVAAPRTAVHQDAGHVVVGSGVMVKVWFAPWFTVTVPLGEMVPLAPAVAAMVWVLMAKLAAMVWLAVTLVKV